MKRRFFIFILLITMALTVPVPSALCYAIDYPYVVIGQNIWLLDRENNARLFLLPETYYARIDYMDEGYYYVTFNGVAGKVERPSVSSVGYHTEAVGTMQEIRIDAKYSYFTEIKLKTSFDGTEEVPVPTNATLLFLGKYPTENETWYYVRYNETCGYVKAEFTSNSDILIPPFVPEAKPTEEEPEQVKETESNSDLVKILIITGLSVAVAVLLIIIFRPRKKGVHKYYYEDVGE